MIVLLGNASLRQHPAEGASGAIVLTVPMRHGPLHDHANSPAHLPFSLGLFAPDRQLLVSMVICTSAAQFSRVIDAAARR